MDRVRQLVELALELAAPVAFGRQLPLPLGLRRLGGGPLLLRPHDRHLDVGQQLTGTGRDGRGHRGLVAQPGAPLLDAGAGLALRTGAPVEGVGAAA